MGASQRRRIIETSPTINTLAPAAFRAAMRAILSAGRAPACR